jgi:hypothetical protein
VSLSNRNCQRLQAFDKLMPNDWIEVVLLEHLPRLLFAVDLVFIQII